MAKNTICVWYDKDAEAAARFYAEVFPDSEVSAVHRAPGDYPSGKEGDVLTVEFTVAGIPCLGLNGGPAFKHSEAFSFQIATDDQAETDRYWDAIVGNGGQASACGWCKDRWGIFLADHPARADRGDGGGRCRGQARVRGHDDHAEDRRRRDRGGAARLRRQRGSREADTCPGAMAGQVSRHAQGAATLCSVPVATPPGLVCTNTFMLPSGAAKRS